MKAGPEEGRGDRQAHAAGGGPGRQGRKDDVSPTLRGLDTGPRGPDVPEVSREPPEISKKGAHRPTLKQW